MSVYKDMAHDAGYRGDEAEQMAQAIEQQAEREAYEQQAAQQAEEAHALSLAVWLHCDGCGADHAYDSRLIKPASCPMCGVAV